MPHRWLRIIWLTARLFPKVVATRCSAIPRIRDATSSRLSRPSRGPGGRDWQVRGGAEVQSSLPDNKSSGDNDHTGKTVAILARQVQYVLFQLIILPSKDCRLDHV